jgi:hypothetical protein
MYIYIHNGVEYMVSTAVRVDMELLRNICASLFVLQKPCCIDRVGTVRQETGRIKDVKGVLLGILALTRVVI